MSVFRNVVSVSSLFAATMAHAQFSVVERFDSGLAGWTFYGDARDLTYQPTFGNPDGCIRAIDRNIGQLWGFSPPAPFLGDISCAYGGSLSWDIHTNSFNSGTGSGSGDFEIVGAGMTLVFDLPTPAIGSWVQRSVQMNENAGWRIDTITGLVPTQAEFRAVLADVTAMRFRLEYSNNADTGNLDNVVLMGCPADFNCDGGSDFFDYLDFVDAFSAGSPSADFNKDTAVDFFDYLDYVDVFSIGC